MHERMLRNLADDVKAEVEAVPMERFRAHLERLLFFDERDPNDVSILPLVMPWSRHLAYQRAAETICRAALHGFADRLDPARFHGDDLQRLVQTFPLQQDVISGNARFDFLEQGNDMRLVEMNFVGVGTVGHSLQATLALLEAVPALKDRYVCLHPTSAFREQLLRGGHGTVALLTKDNDRDYYASWLDRVIIAEGVKPVRMIIVPRHQWPEFSASGGTLSFRGMHIDAVYPREMTWRKSIEAGADWCRFFLSSGAFCLDHWSLVLAEEKDLRFLVPHDRAVEQYLPRTWSLDEIGPDVDPTGLVLKRKHDHGGEGVWVAPTELPSVNRDDYVLQERIPMDRIRVRSLLGFEGVVSYDIAAHISFDYNLRTRSLLACNVSGYLSRYAPHGDVVNISQGGGVIPVLVERMTA